jgi:hypothetical protein
MPVRRKTKKAKQKAVRQLADKVRFKLEDRPEEDLKYWLIHVVHWHAFLVAVIAVLTIGNTYFNINR